MVLNLKDAFKNFEDDFLDFDSLIERLSSRPDLNAFTLLDKLIPSKNNQAIISASRYQEYYLSIDVKELEKVITEKEVQALVRCGVRYDTTYNALCLFS